MLLWAYRRRSVKELSELPIKQKSIAQFFPRETKEKEETGPARTTPLRSLFLSVRPSSFLSRKREQGQPREMIAAIAVNHYRTAQLVRLQFLLLL